MAASKAEKKAIAKWQKSNTTIVSVRLQNKGDSDILKYLEGKSRAGMFKLAIREYMKNHPEE